MRTEKAIADTSIFIGRETGRLDDTAIPRSLSVSVITVGELKAGLLAADGMSERAARLRSLTDALALDPFPIDDLVADVWAELRMTTRRSGHRLKANDSWIAATAIAHGLPLTTQDGDFDGVPGLEVIKV